MKNLSIKITGIFITVFLFQVNLSAQDLQVNLFQGVNQSMLEAKNAQADVLSPRAYGEALEEYNEAKKKYDNDGELSEIKKNIKEATENTKVSSVMFSSVLSARRDAMNAEASQFVKEMWQDAEEEMKDAA